MSSLREGPWDLVEMSLHGVRIGEGLLEPSITR